MSQHSDEQQLVGACSDSFWEPGNYKRSTRRLDDGHRLCGELAQLLAERADIEKAYAKGLRGWAKKWNDLIEKGPEYGTTEAAWKGALVEAERLCELHLRVRDNLVNDVIQQIKNWQKDSYHKSMIQLKERKEMDEAFKKAQKPWVKLLQRVERARGEYHTACKQERSAQNQERNASGDSSFSPDQREVMVKKMAERVSKSREEVSRWREKYQAALAEINAYNPRYVEDMGGVFDRCQAMEAQRLVFFKEVLFGVHKCLNISQDPVLPQIYEEFYHTVNNADHQKDLKWWANNHGVNMPMAWPQFEKEPPYDPEEEKQVEVKCFPAAMARLAKGLRDVNWCSALPASAARHTRRRLAVLGYWPQSPAHATLHQVAPCNNPRPYVNSFTEYTEEFRDIAKGKSKESLPSGPITLIHQRPVGDDLPELPAGQNNSKQATAVPMVRNSMHTESAPSATTTHIEKKAISSPVAVTNGTINNTTTNNAAGATTTDGKSAGGRQENPFDEDEWEEEEGGALVDNGEPGVPVRALYDYTGAESDELSFRQGDLFEKLEDEDEQGWCKGRKDGRVGLYPANYVEPVGH